MNNIDKFVNDIAQKLGNAIAEATYYKTLYEEAIEKYKQVNDLLAKFNKVLESNQAIKELFDEASDKIEEVSE